MTTAAPGARRGRDRSAGPGAPAPDLPAPTLELAA